MNKRPNWIGGLVWVCMCLGWITHAQAQEDFSATYTGDACGPLTATFTPVTDGSRTVTGYSWDFGNGNTSTLVSPSASYVTAQTYTVSLTVTYDDGIETVTKPDFIEIFGRPTVDFTSDITGGCTPLEVTFSDLSTPPPGGTITTRLWEFEGGGSANQATETVTFSDPGTYSVTLYVETDQGCSETINVPEYIRAEDQVAPDFTPNSAQLTCEPTLAVDFSNTTPGTGGGNYAFQWDFGDGNMSTEVAPTHTYTVPGSYTVSLTLEETLSGCVGGTETRTDLVRLVDYQVGFRANPTSGCNPLAVQFTDTSNLQLAQQTVLWDFGDGSDPLVGTGTGGIRTPTHTYTTPGTYTVTLSIEDPLGACEGSTTASGLVTVPNPVIADFSADETLFCEDTFTVNFSNASVNGVSYDWDFGDGTTSTDTNPSHTFAGNGVYPVTLTATAATGCTDVFVDTVYSIPLVAGFVVTNTDGCAPVTTDLVNTTVSVTPVTSYFWEIRDAGNAVVFSSTDENPTGVTLSAAGDYDVIFAIAGPTGCTDTLREVIQVGIPPLSMDFVADDTVLCNGDTVRFTNLSVEDGTNPFPVRYQWDYINDGQLEEGTPRDGEHIYANLDSGFYGVELRYLSNGCQQRLLRDDYLYINTPRAEFALTTDLCTPDSLWGENLSVGGDRWQWDIQDTTGAIVYSDTVNFDLATLLSPGQEFSVFLTVFNDSVGCSDTYTEDITLPDALPDFGIGISQDTVCVDQTLTVGSSADADTYFWSFTTDTVTVTASGDTIAPFFDYPGLYDLTLTLTVNGCALDTTWEDAFRIADPLVRIGADTFEGCAPLTVNFHDNSISDVNILSRYWILGTDTLSSDSTFSYVFDSAQNPQSTPYTIALSVTTVDSCTSTRTAEVRVTDPTADFMIDSTFACEGTELTLIANTADSLLYTDPADSLAFVWTSNPSFALPSEATVSNQLFPNGTYDISLRVRDINGCTDSLTESVVVNRVLPQADFIADPTEVFCPPAAVSFTDVSEAGNAGIASWFWSFGDGTASTLQNPVRIFREPGEYSVQLVIIDSMSCRDTLTRTEYLNIQGPIGSFTVDDTLGYAPLEVMFSGSSPDEGVEFLWDFANGEVEGFFTDSTYVYTYVTGGNFFPVMTIRDSRGCDYAPDPEIGIEVLPCPELDLGPDRLACTADAPLLLDGYDSTHEISVGTLHYLWNTGDTTSRTTPVVALGTTEYSLELWVIDDEGRRVCDVADTVAVTYAPNPEASFTVTNACLGETSQLISTSTVSQGQIVGYSWDTDGDGSPEAQTAQGQYLHIYDALGTFSPILIVETDSGCTDTATLPVEVLEVPSATVAATDTCVNLPNRLSVSVILATGESITQYAWDADGDSIFEAEGADITTTEITRDSAGVYQGYVRYTASNGCEATDTLRYEVFPLPEISFTPMPALLCLGNSLTVRASGAETYVWADGTVADSLTVRPLRDTTRYGVTATSAQGCVSRDTAQVVLLNHPFLLPEMRACTGDTLELNASIPGLSTTHVWSTGSTDSILAVTEPGLYSVTTQVLDSGLVCEVYSETRVVFDQPTPIPVEDVTVCFDDVPEVVIEPGLSGSYLWQPYGSTDSIFVTAQADTVHLFFTNARGCESDTVVRIIEDCIPRVVFPDAFTPNSDGLNDVLYPVGQYFINYHVEIYNRWGEIVFVSDDPSEGWDGRQRNGQPHLTGVYMILLVYESQFNPGTSFTRRETVLLTY